MQKKGLTLLFVLATVFFIYVPAEAKTADTNNNSVLTQPAKVANFTQYRYFRYRGRIYRVRVRRYRRVRYVRRYRRVRYYRRYRRY
jgi:hypothetical protein